MLDKVTPPGSTHYPAPEDHLENDPTPRNQAVYIPSVSPGYAIAAYAKNYPRDLPAGVDPEDMNFLDPCNKLFKISHVMSSAGQALFQKQPCIIQTRDRKSTRMIGDSGGYQIASGSLKIRNDADRMAILRWLEQHADWAMTLDVPTGPLLKKGYAFESFKDCLNTTLDHLEFFQKNRVAGATRFLNVLQGNDTKQSDEWYNSVKVYDFEGWAFAGKLRHNFFNLCRRIIKMADENKIQDRNWIHILGTSDPETGVGLTALQRAINKYGVNPNLRISFDTSSPFRNIRWRNVYTLPSFSRDGMSMPTVQCPDQRKLVGKTDIRFPWPSPLGDKLTLGDICVRQGHNLNSYRDSQSNWYLQNHNLAALCYGIALANRVFDSESFEKRHSLAAKMGRTVEAIDEVIKSGSLTVLEKRRSIFNAVRPVEPPFESEEERDFLED